MSVLIMHARWNDLSTHQMTALQDLVEQARSEPGCCSSSSRQDSVSVLLTAVWEDEGALLAFTRGPLAAARTTARLDEPQVALFAVPAPFAAAYRRPAAAVIPAPRETAASAQLVG